SLVRFAGGELWAGGLEAPVDRRVRVRIMARAVSIALERPHRPTILNVRPACAAAVRPAGRTMLLRRRGGRRRAGGTGPGGGGPPRLLARITRRSFDALGLAPGDRVYAQVKAVALMRGAEGDG